MENTSYVKLTDPRHHGTVVRMYIIGKQRYHERYKNGEWVRTSLMIEYHYPDADLYDEYESITEEEANRLISNDSYVNYEDLDRYESEASIEILDQMFMLSDKLEIPKDIEKIRSYDHSRKKD